MDGARVHGLAKNAYLSLKNEYGPAVSRSTTELRRFTENEVSSWGEWRSMALRRRLWLWRHGFLSRAEVQYDVREDNYREYLSDYQRERAAWLNGDRSVALDNKLLFQWMMEPFAAHRVDTYGLLRGGRFHDVNGLRRGADGVGSVTTPAGDTTDAATWVTDRLESEGRLVLKPCRGGGGKNVMLCSFDDGSYAVNGEEHSSTAFESLVAALDEYLVSEAVEQADYASGLFPDATNTLRFLTIYDDAADEPYLPIVAHRIGTEQSAPIDNCSSGGLTTEVDRATGELGPAAYFPSAERLDWHDTHPDTGARIEGVEVPGWEVVKQGILDMAATFSHTPYIGWDVVVTGEGEFTVIEANNCTGVRVFQIHRPLLDDARLRRFYERHGIVPSAGHT